MLRATTQLDVALHSDSDEVTETTARVYPGIVAAYIRLTRDESLKGLSAVAQKSDITDYAHRSRLSPLIVYEEPRAVGGDVPFERRERGKQLIADIKAGQVTDIIVRDMDRLTRDVHLWLKFAALCDEHGVTIHTLSGPLADKSPTDKFASTVRAAAAQLEKDQVADRVRRVKRAMARRGRYVGGPPPYGYTSQARRRAELTAAGVHEDQARAQAQAELPQKGHLYVDHNEAEVVQLVFDLYVNRRWGSRRITNELNQLGHRRRSGLLWHPDKIRRVINDPVVAGLVPFDEVYFEAGRGRRTPRCSQELYPGKHDPIVSQEIWRRAQEIKRTNTCHHSGKGDASYANRKYVLSGILNCPCGSPMAARSAGHGKPYGYYVCRKRKYYGSDAIGGCNFPQINTEKVHEAFWRKLGEMIHSPDLANRVCKAAEQVLCDQVQIRKASHSPVGKLRKVETDLNLWYERHDTTKSDIEKEAAWRRIVDLTKQHKRLKQQADRQTEKTPPPPVKVNQRRVAKYLKSLSKLMADGEDQGKAFVQSLVEHHSLMVRLRDASTLVVSLRLQPPGSEADQTAEYAVPLEGEARLPSDKITVWVNENQDKHKCKCGCGRTIRIIRQHYWRGIPEFHSDCRHKGMIRKRAELASGYYTGRQAADRLGIGRTTLNRWITKGKVPKPKKSISGMLLFSRKEIDLIARG